MPESTNFHPNLENLVDTSLNFYHTEGHGWGLHVSELSEDEGEIYFAGLRQSQTQYGETGRILWDELRKVKLDGDGDIKYEEDFKHIEKLTYQTYMEMYYRPLGIDGLSNDWLIRLPLWDFALTDGVDAAIRTAQKMLLESETGEMTAGTRRAIECNYQTEGFCYGYNLARIYYYQAPLSLNSPWRNSPWTMTRKINRVLECTHSAWENSNWPSTYSVDNPRRQSAWWYA